MTVQKIINLLLPMSCLLLAACGGGGTAANLPTEVEATPAVFIVGGMAWVDENEDGIANPDETGLPSVQVDLYLYSDNRLVGSTTTGADGTYEFTTGQVDYYFVHFASVPGYTFTAKDRTSVEDETMGVSSDVVDSDVYPSGEQMGSTDQFLVGRDNKAQIYGPEVNRQVFAGYVPASN